MSRPASPTGTPARGGALPRILLHSDLHLETGPFSLPESDGPAIAVFAGDVKPGVDSLAALQRITSLPAVFVAGNHEFWGGDYFEVLEQLRTSPAGNVHFLENREVVLDGVRFLGATLWTDYGSGNRALMDYGLWQMRDHRCIRAARWWTAANKARFLATFGHHALEKFEGQFNPLLARELHGRSVAWLRRALRKPFSGPTVIVTHHAPTYASLTRSGTVKEYALERRHWQRRMNDDLNLTQVGSYASDTLAQLQHELERADVRLWAHGHVHHALQFGQRAIRVACNPRGRVQPPLTEESARGLALFGMRLTAEDIARSQQHAREFPEDGDGVGYDRAFALGLDGSAYDLIQAAHVEAVQRLAELRGELRELRVAARSRRPMVSELAAHRADTLRLQAIEAVRAFANEMSQQLLPGFMARRTDSLQWALRACHLETGRFHGKHSVAGFDNVADFDIVKRFGSTDEIGERTSAARKHLQSAERMVHTLSTLLGRAERACASVLKERQRFFR